MAFECGALASSGGKSPLQALKELLAYLESEDPHISHEEIMAGDGWAGTDIRISRPGETELEQYVQVRVGGEILKSRVESARANLGGVDLGDRDLMFTTTLSGVTDPIANDLLMAYVLEEWHGIQWDESSGFYMP